MEWAAKARWSACERSLWVRQSRSTAAFKQNQNIQWPCLTAKTFGLSLLHCLSSRFKCLHWPRSWSNSDHFYRRWGNENTLRTKAFKDVLWDFLKYLSFSFSPEIIYLIKHPAEILSCASNCEPPIAPFHCLLWRWVISLNRIIKNIACFIAAHQLTC